MLFTWAGREIRNVSRGQRCKDAYPLQSLRHPCLHGRGRLSAEDHRNAAPAAPGWMPHPLPGRPRSAPPQRSLHTTMPCADAVHRAPFRPVRSASDSRWPNEPSQPCPDRATSRRSLRRRRVAATEDLKAFAAAPPPRLNAITDRVARSTAIMIELLSPRGHPPLLSQAAFPNSFPRTVPQRQAGPVRDC